MKKTLALAGFGTLLLIALAGCSPVTNSDREGGAGNLPDKVFDTQAVELYRNADNIPNVAYFCAGDLGWAATLSNDSSTSNPQLVRLTEYDSVCADLPNPSEVSVEEYYEPEAE